MIARWTTRPLHPTITPFGVTFHGEKVQNKAVKTLFAAFFRPQELNIFFFRRWIVKKSLYLQPCINQELIKSKNNKLKVKCRTKDL